MEQSEDGIREHVQKHFELLRDSGGDKRQVLFDLFSGLNYRVLPDLPPPLSTTDWSEAARAAISEDAPFGPAIIAEGGGSGRLDLDFGDGVRPGGFKIIYIPIQEGQTNAAPLRLTDERVIAERLMRDDAHPDSLLVFSDPKQQYWHFVNVRRVTRAEAERRGLRRRHRLRRIAVGPEDKLRTAIDQFSKIALPLDLADTATAQQIHERHDQAFNVEQVTDDFFRDFKERYFELEESLLQQVDDRQWAHDYALRLLSRLMFVYFIQRKRWIANDSNFMATYWERYQKATGGDGTFYPNWLWPLFFEAFQDAGTSARILQRKYIPEDLRQALRNAPYLNGGLFRQEQLDRKHAEDFEISDGFFATLLHSTEDLTEQPGFLERYNFTISEDSPLDQEVAVDPEMIGRVYESLVNISESSSDIADDREEQRKAGIFYTPRTEIDLMCRLALSDYLRNHLGEQHRDLIYELTFSLEAEEKEAADKKVSEVDLWPAISHLLEHVTVVDPACGSGSFLVGMMNILADLRLRADEYVGRNPTVYGLHRDIIRTSLYGVDVMDWACHVAELRLWLQLMIHADPAPGELQGPRPLLPNLSFKIRHGDSLVQELGGVNLAHLKADADIEPATKSELRRLRSDKLSFYDAQQQDPEREAALHAREQNLFLRICREKAAKLERRMTEIEDDLAATTPTLMGDEPAVKGQERKRLEARRESFDAQVQRLEQVRAAIGQQKQVPFVWDLAFVEIFEGEDQGFDIVVGNPPYVRQEKIADPAAEDGQSRPGRDRYKNALQRSVYAAYPHYFGRDPGDPRLTLSRRSDLYIYFYFHALSLLNPRGAFCFVTSNSWLDVGYGKELQEFLARQVPMHMAIDNQVKRSFALSDVNTVIVLFGAPREERNACLDHTTRFVMAQVPFEQMLHPVFMWEIDGATERTQKPEFRVFPKEQRELLEAGIEGDDEDEGNRLLDTVGNYGGDKWGGKYLRAPEIYWEILERAGDRLVPLGESAEVRFGIKTGCNEFFYLPNKHFEIEVHGDEVRLIPLRDGPIDIRLPISLLHPAMVRLIHATQPVATAEAASHWLVDLPAD
ncbi:MAG: DNA methyltransferase, partial [Chloroflexota bacterium]|nr:DNA methyltransferase [Chloroflexota bacterium]